jgi:hypothetical protein
VPKIKQNKRTHKTPGKKLFPHNNFIGFDMKIIEYLE